MPAATIPVREPRRTRSLGALLLTGLVACAPGRPAPRVDPGGVDVLRVMAAFDQAAETPLWPGFDPRAVPVALYDGERTLLFRHPSPPEGFAPLPGGDGVLAYPGRHPLLRANTSVELGGVQTAMVVLDSTGAALGPARRSALIAHEAFHVFQRQRHPNWAGNEAELFTYPVADIGLLQVRRLETEALRRALASAWSAPAACWAYAALELRSSRFRRMPAGAAAYERGTELNEGLAQYVERKVSGGDPRELLPAAGFPAAAVRERGYATGAALALLLDRFSPAWAERMERGEHPSLDQALAAALPEHAASGCRFTAEEERAALLRAADDVERHRRELQAQQARFLGADGWTLVVIGEGEPLWPQGFDPLNVRTLEAGRVLHTRWIKLGNSAGTVEVLDRASLSEPAGDHPLFNGVRRLVVTGLPEPPLVRDSAGVTIVSAAGIHARVRGTARVEKRTLMLRVGSVAAP